MSCDHHVDFLDNRTIKDVHENVKEAPEERAAIHHCVESNSSAEQENEMERFHGTASAEEE